MALFGRQVIFEVGQPGTPGRRLTGLRVSFRVRMSKSRNPNTATIEVYNANERTIALAQQPGAVVRLLAGYDTPRQIFQGEGIRNGVFTKKQGPDRILHFEGKDGGARYQAARVDVTFTTETTLRQVLDEVTAQLGLPLGTVRLDRDVRFPQGIALRGPARDVLDRIAAMQARAGDRAYDWFVRDGALQLIAPDGDTGEAAVEISADRGNLIGSPTPKDRGIEVTALLEPSMRPGRKFRLQARTHSGLYVAGDVHFAGDSGFDTPFYVTATGREV